MSFDVDNIQKNMFDESLPEGMTMVGTPPFVCKKGSFTVEAALLLPILACFFSFILFFFQIMQIQLSVQEALEKTGRNLAILSAGENDSIRNEKRMKDVSYLALAKTSVYLELQKNEFIEKYVNGGAMGISLLYSDMQGDYIVLNANYVIRFPLEILGRYSFRMNQRTCFRKWTGWHVVDVQEQKDKLVYITMYGEVYHMRKSCPYLALSIQRVERIYIPILRNVDGSKYRECSICKKEDEGEAFIYVTAYGEKYHYSVGCSGLKRTIYSKSLSDVKGMKSCTKCSK